MTTDYANLHAKISDKTAQVAVIGLGTVGLPTAMMIASKGFHVIGIDRDDVHIHVLREGMWPYEDSDPLAFQEFGVRMALRPEMTTFSSDYTAAANADVFVVCVPTCVGSNGKPDLAVLDNALAEIAEVARRPVLIIIESTVPPGTMEHYSHTMIEHMRRGGAVYLAHCPERTTLGMLFHNLVHVPRIVGGADDDCVLAWVLYKSFTLARIYTTDAATAEMVKVVENAYRFVQISFSNELALVCQDIGLDVWDVIRLVNTCPERTLLQPGPGVGGPCLLKDTAYLRSISTGMDEPSIALAAIQVNAYMAEAVSEMVCKLLNTVETGNKPTVAILGTAYRKEVRDDRNSPAASIVTSLRHVGVSVRAIDPVVNPNADVLEAVNGADVIIIATCHKEIRDLDWAEIGQVMRHRLIVDTRNCLRGIHMPDGFTIRYLGVG